jgi:hypothetical protein
MMRKEQKEIHYCSIQSNNSGIRRQKTCHLFFCSSNKISDIQKKRKYIKWTVKIIVSRKKKNIRNIQIIIRLYHDQIQPKGLSI